MTSLEAVSTPLLPPYLTAVSCAVNQFFLLRKSTTEKSNMADAGEGGKNPSFSFHTAHGTRLICRLLLIFIAPWSGWYRFMQDGAPPHIANRVKQLLRRHFLKDVVFSTPIANIAELKTRIAQHILNFTPDTLRSVVEHAVSRFNLVAQNGGQHIEHVLRQSRET